MKIKNKTIGFLIGIFVLVLIIGGIFMMSDNNNEKNKNVKIESNIEYISIELYSDMQITRGNY